MEKELAASLARRLGLVFDEAVVLGEGMNVLVQLRPTPIVARVTRLAHLVRPPESLAGGVALAKALGQRAVPPSALIDPGPHLVAGRYVTFWTYRPGRAASPSEAGAALRALHENAEFFSGPLRSFDPRPEALRVAGLVGGEASEILRDAANRLMPPTLAAYGACDLEAVEALQPLVVLGIAAWGSLAPLIGESSPRTAHRLEWLRHH